MDTLRKSAMLKDAKGAAAFNAKCDQMEEVEQTIRTEENNKMQVDREREEENNTQNETGVKLAVGLIFARHSRVIFEFSLSKHYKTK